MSKDTIVFDRWLLLLLLQFFLASNNVNTSGFDNAAIAMLSVFQVMTLSGWSFVMYRVVDTISYGAVVYFIILVLFGSYFGKQLPVLLK